MTQPISIADFLSLSNPVPLIDVRTPLEFAQGHVTGAFNIPLFSNEERVQVGTTYKQQSREAAILLGFDLTGGKWSGFIRQALAISPHKKVAVHCWRGGMRSSAMAWALGLYGFEVYVIAGGYKQYRRWALQQSGQQYRLLILGGMTGSGKTKILHQLKETANQVIDLEALAQHQGSAYGTMGKMVQPTQEQFENNFALELSKLDKQRPIWVEDESLTIGKCAIPKPFWNQMRSAALINLTVAVEDRIALSVVDYGGLDKDYLVECTERIHKRLGPEQTKQAIAAIRENRMADFVKLVLVYYDKTYRTGLAKRNTELVFNIETDKKDIDQIAQQVLDFSKTISSVMIATA